MKFRASVLFLQKARNFNQLREFVLQTLLPYNSHLDLITTTSRLKRAKQRPLSRYGIKPPNTTYHYFVEMMWAMRGKRDFQARNL